MAASGWDAAAWANELLGGAQTPPYDALLVLAGGVDDDGRTHPAVARRLDAAAELWRRSGGALAVIANGGGALPRSACAGAHPLTRTMLITCRHGAQAALARRRRLRGPRGGNYGLRAAGARRGGGVPVARVAE